MSKIQIVTLFLSLFVFACTPEDVGKEEKKIPESFYGNYKGQTTDGILLNKVSIDTLNEDGYNFVLYSFLRLTTPGFPIRGIIDTNSNIRFEPYSCRRCIDLPSPGGTKRYYDADFSGEGFYLPVDSTITLNVQYEQTGTQWTKYNGPISLKRVP